jgi:hypothetical protein
MSKKSDLFGVSKFEMGDPGDGIMGTSLTEFNDIMEGTVTIALPKAETVKIFSETNRVVPYRVISAGSKDAPKVELKLLGVDLDKWSKFLGGTYTALTKTWAIPSTSNDLYQSIRITTKETDAAGSKLAIEIPFGLLTAGIEGNLTYNNLANIAVTIEAMTPVSELGVEGNALIVKEV